MIQLFEIQIKSELQNYWNNMISNIGKPNDILPFIFAGLPATGSGGSNQAAIADLFTKLNDSSTDGAIQFLLQFPQNKSFIPSISVETGPEQEIEVIGSEIGYDKLPDGTWQHNIGGVFNRQYAIGIYTFNVDTTLYLYAFIKYFLLDMRGKFGLQSNITISSREMMVDPQNYGTPVYYRFIDIIAEGIVDFVVNTYSAITSIDVNETSYFNTETETLSIKDDES